jgi:hypothetical protein
MSLSQWDPIWLPPRSRDEPVEREEIWRAIEEHGPHSAGGGDPVCWALAQHIGPLSIPAATSVSLGGSLQGPTTVPLTSLVYQEGGAYLDTGLLVMPVAGKYVVTVATTWPEFTAARTIGVSLQSIGSDVQLTAAPGTSGCFFRHTYSYICHLGIGNPVFFQPQVNQGGPGAHNLLNLTLSAVRVSGETA